MNHFWQSIEGYLDHFDLYDLAVSKFNKGVIYESVNDNCLLRR
jgi:hypothetical protein